MKMDDFSMFVLMILANYISDLLYRHECVIVPGFGAIIARRIPAQHFLSSHTIYPPKRGLSFNSQITQSDGLLESHVASMKSISYDDARLEISAYVQELSQEIDEHGTATLYKIGRFYRNADDKLEFTPMYVLNYLPEAFGLGTQELYAIDREQPEEVGAVAAQTVVHAPVIPLQVKETETTVSEDEKVEPAPTVKESTPWLRYAATAVVLLGMGYLGYTGYENHKQEESIAIEQRAEDRVKARVQEANIFISAPLPSIELSAAAQVKNFHIVAGAFREPENAIKRVGQLQAEGFNARVIGVNKYGLHNVTFDSYASREVALAALADLKQKGYSTAWLLSGSLENN